MMPRPRRTLGWGGIPVFIGGMALLMGVAQIGFRLSHDAQRRNLERDGTLVEAVIKEKEKVSQSRHKGQAPSKLTETLWIRYLPKGAEDTKDNLVWESVSQRDFDKFKQGQPIHAWMLGDEHYIRERSGFHSDVPDWVFLLVGVLLIVGGISMRRIGREAGGTQP